MTRSFMLGVLLLAGLAIWGCASEERAGQERTSVTEVNSTTTTPAPSWADSLDAVQAAPENHKVVLENDKVRVLDVTVGPGELEKVHGHKWPSVLYVMAEDDIVDYDEAGNVLYDSKTDPNPMKAPYTVWMEPQKPHAVKNRSDKPLRLLRVELKQ